MTLAILLISEQGLGTARTVAEGYPGATLASTSVQAGGCLPIDSYERFLQANWHRFDAFLFVGAMGICVRCIAPHVRDKHDDPAVVCVDSSGRYAIPVLSGHVGGANALAQDVARLLGAEPVVTTQTDLAGLWPLDTLGTKYGWTTLVAPPGGGRPAAPAGSHGLNALIARFARREPTLLYLAARVPGTDELVRSCPPHVSVRHGNWGEIDLEPYALVILVTPFLHDTAGKPALYYVPRVLHAGIGLARQAGPVDEILRLVDDTLLAHRLLPEALCGFATIAEKRREPVVRKLQDTFPVQFYQAAELAGTDVPNPSDTVRRHMGTPGVCEAAAILSAGGGRLVLDKQKGTNYTLAAAVPQGVLADRGHIEIVGAGPGDPELISVRGRRMLRLADLILYAGSLVNPELTHCAKPGAVVRSSADMDLQAQFRLMKEYYDRGGLVVRLHTGDPCIYGAIQEQMNLFDSHGMQYHITPGISSFLAAAAALRSQFTIPGQVQSIILTRGEGRTPMPEREKLRLLARSRSTMCIFLSASLVDEVQAELLQEYPEDTPVAACYRLTWKDERIYRGKLKDLARLVKDNHLSLTTLLVVGDAIGNRRGLSRLYSADFKHLFRP